MMVRYKRENYRPKRGIRLALTCGEETPNVFNGVKYLIEHHRDLIDAQFTLNEGGGGRYDQDTGEYRFVSVIAAEKLYQDFTLTNTNEGGHSSRPMPDNAIYQLAHALDKIEAYSFPIEFSDVTRPYFEKFGAIEGGEKGKDMIAAASGDEAAIGRIRKDPSNNAILHTNCVATQVNGGHAPNALPQRATANVNCRIFPGHQGGNPPATHQGHRRSAVGVRWSTDRRTAGCAGKSGPVEALTTTCIPASRSSPACPRAPPPLPHTRGRCLLQHLGMLARNQQRARPQRRIRVNAY
jgi:hypothetical protein